MLFNLGLDSQVNIFMQQCFFQFIYVLIFLSVCLFICCLFICNTVCGGRDGHNSASRLETRLSSVQIRHYIGLLRRVLLAWTCSRDSGESVTHNYIDYSGGGGGRQ